MKKKILTAAMAALGMLVLILDGKTALNGAAEGVELCIRSVIPSLFPFLVLSTLLTASLSGMQFPFLRPLCRLVGIPEGGEGLLAVGFLGGYPVGAQSIAQLYHQGQLSKKTAQRLLMFCSNAGPAFIFGIVAPQFSSQWAAWAIFVILILSSLIVGAILPGKQPESVHSADKDLTITDAVLTAISVMSRICGWVILFRILAAFLTRWVLWLLPADWAAIVTGILELTGGCCALTVIADENLRFLAATVMLSFGGFCVWLQTAAVTGELGTGSYLKGKLLQAGISTLLAWIVISRNLWGMMLLVMVAVICREAKKRSSNSAAVGV